MAQITLRDYLQETEDVIDRGRVDDALNRCQYVLARFPESLEAQRLLGEVYLAQGHYDEAQQTFDWVLTNDPENVVVYCSRALISERRTDYDTALDCYQQAYELSRGNNSIRNEFNKLSAKVGQQGFMFSRAGLARLYMRGDLLTQAIQEWEAVLAVTPDRLDARTGLLEAYWRDGLYDRVEQLATQILQDVPGCEKALLLLAYVVSPKDMEQARELLQRVETLDPDLVMAQDLFSDLMASQPNEPFLALLKKNPVALEKAQEQESIAPTNGTYSQQEDVFAAPNGATISSSLPGWAGLESWNGENTLLKASPEPDVSLPPTDFPAWASDNFAALSDTRTALNQGQNATTEANGAQEQPDLAAYLNGIGSSGSSWELPQQQSSGAGEQQEEPWMLLQASLNEMKKEFETSSSQEQHSALDLSQWGIAENPPEQPSLSGFEWGGNEEQTVDATSFANSWSATPKETNAAAAPDWLSTLTQPGERRQMSGNLPPVPAAAEPVAPSIQPLLEPQAPVVAQTPVVQEPIVPPVSPQPVEKVAERKPEPEKKEEPAFSPFAAGGDDDEEESFFGPQWLKALGAASMDDEEAAAEEPPVQPVPSTVQEAPQTYEPWTAPATAEAVQEPAIAWNQPVEQSPAQEAAWGTATESVPPLTPAASSPEYSWSQSPEIEQKPTSSPEYSWSQALEQQPPSQPEYSWSQALEQQAAPSNEYNWSQALEQPSTSSPEYSWSQALEQQSSSPQEYNWSQALEQQAAPSNEYSWSQALEQQLASSPEYSWSQALESKQEPQKVGEVLPLTPEETNGWEQPDELYWDGQPATADNDYTFEAVAPIRTTETASAEPFDKTEQQMLLTLEELEKNLLSDGFVPLEPNWLANLAQEQNGPSSSPVEEPAWEQQETYVEPPLSSALAELGNFVQQASTSSVVEPPIIEEPPLWSAPPQPVQQAQPVAPPLPTPQPVQQEKPAAALRPTPVPVPPPLRQQPKPLPEDDFDDGDAPTTHVAAVKPPVKPVVRAIPPKKLSEPVKPTPVTPAARKDAFADMELETTMRRPAIRLQPIQQRPAASQEQSRSHGRAVSGKGAEVSYQELLLKGYQYQLLGDYDDAMQEYRAVIRNAPDLLGEVISNVRALLKLAPNYSTGYRVLGDAYMRQGEYLQAMEAYNRALTMAKKAKA